MLDEATVQAWFRPRNIVVLGASKSRPAQGNLFLRRQRAFGFGGPIHVIHPEGGTVDGEACLRSIAELPEPVDFAFVAIPASGVADVLRAASGRVRVVQVMTSGFREAGAQGADLEQDLVRLARSGGMRLIGPNCFGTYSPAGRLTMLEHAPREPGRVGFVAQSGGMSCEVIMSGVPLGVRFSRVATLGNSADVDIVDVFEHFVEAGDTDCIGMYVEEVRRSGDFAEVARRVEGRKPVLVMKGGTTGDGRRAAHAHTGAVAEEAGVFEDLAARYGLALVSGPEDMALAMAMCAQGGPRPLRDRPRCALVGPGGGLGVLTVDAFNREGIDVPAFGDAVRSALLAGGLPAEGSGLSNPVDVSVMSMGSRGGGLAAQIFHTLGSAADVDWIVAHIHLPNLCELAPNGADLLDRYVGGFIEARRANPEKRWCLVLRSSGATEFEELRGAQRRRAVEAGIPVCERLGDAARAIAAVSRFELHRRRLAG